MELFHRYLLWQQKTLRAIESIASLQLPGLSLPGLLSAGITGEMPEMEKRKLRVFNQLNIIQFFAGIIMPVAGLLFIQKLPAQTWLVSLTPAFLSAFVLYLNRRNRVNEAQLFYFFAYPVFTCFIYLHGINPGIELHFILFGILSVFYIQDRAHMLFSICLSMVSYYILSVVLQNYIYPLRQLNPVVYMFNQGLAIAYIFYGLYLIRTQNEIYQHNIEQQKKELEIQAVMLNAQKEKLNELNQTKDKLFSVISHDLKVPLYALRNLFVSSLEMKISAREIKSMLPDVINDLNYTTCLMENLLQWAKSQMQARDVNKTSFDPKELAGQVIHLLRLPAEMKKINMTVRPDNDLDENVFADRDMIHLVLRNIVGNAIKFTPSGGNISIVLSNHPDGVQFQVKDSGIGMNDEQLAHLNSTQFYTTRGTDSETGTGLGLMLCREFLSRNGSNLGVSSKAGEGSVFSFILEKDFQEI